MRNRIFISSLYIITVAVVSYVTSDVFEKINKIPSVEISFTIVLAISLAIVVLFHMLAESAPSSKNLLFLLITYIVANIITAIIASITFGALLLNFSLALMFCRYFNVRSNLKNVVGISQLFQFIAYSIFLFLMFNNILPLFLCIIFILSMLKIALTFEEKIKEEIINIKRAIRLETVYFFIGVNVICLLGTIIGG